MPVSVLTQAGPLVLAAATSEADAAAALEVLAGAALAGADGVAGALAGAGVGAGVAAGAGAGVAASAVAAFLLLWPDFLGLSAAAVGAAASGVAAASVAAAFLLLCFLGFVAVSVWVALSPAAVSAFFFFLAKDGVATRLSARPSMVAHVNSLVWNTFISWSLFILKAASSESTQAERGNESLRARQSLTNKSASKCV